jgi:nucleoside-diphosphate-sugar epimerase
MKVLFIGGTGLISSACAERALELNIEVTIFNRGVSKIIPVPEKVHLLLGDIHGDLGHIKDLLGSQHFDAVVDFVAFTRKDAERDIRLFHGKTGQFVFISSASAYQKPPRHFVITENTPLENPYWEYSRNKIACEDLLMQEYQNNGFPVTIVRPSLTYGPSHIPLCLESWNYPYTLLDRMKKGKPVIIPGDGTSLWVITWNADFAKGFVGLLGNPKAIGEAFTITSDEVRTWNYFYEEVARALEVKLHPVYIASDLLAEYDPDLRGSLIGDKVNSVVFDNTKIKSLVPEFNCTVPWAEGVRRSIKWFEADLTRCTVDEQANQLWDRIIQNYNQCEQFKR